MRFVSSLLYSYEDRSHLLPGPNREPYLGRGYILYQVKGYRSMGVPIMAKKYLYTATLILLV